MTKSMKAAKVAQFYRQEVQTIKLIINAL